MDTVNLITPEVTAIIRELGRNGIKSSDEQSDILKRDHGIDIPSHFIAEYKYRKKLELE